MKSLPAYHPLFIYPVQSDESVEYTPNNFLSVIQNTQSDIFKSYSNISEKFKPTGFRKYLMDKIRSNKREQLRKLYRTPIKEASSSVLKMSIEIAPHFKVSHYDISQILSAYLINLEGLLSELADKTINDIDTFVTDTAYRDRVFVDTKESKAVLKRVEDVSKMLTNGFNAKHDDPATTCLIGDIYGNTKEIMDTASTMVTIPINESKLSNHLEYIKIIKARVEMLKGLTAFNTNSKSIESISISLNALANGFTLIGKMYYTYFELTDALINIKQTVK